MERRRSCLQVMTCELDFALFTLRVTTYIRWYSGGDDSIWSLSLDGDIHLILAQFFFGDKTLGWEMIFCQVVSTAVCSTSLCHCTAVLLFLGIVTGVRSTLK